MNKIEDILNNLQAQQPMLKDEDAFIDCIMDGLPDLPEEEKPSPYIIMLRTISSLAAAVVIGWFIFLNVGGTSNNDDSSAETDISGCYASVYSNLRKYSNPQEAMKDYSERQTIDIHKLISMYDGK